MMVSGYVLCEGWQEIDARIGARHVAELDDGSTFVAFDADPGAVGEFYRYGRVLTTSLEREVDGIAAGPKRGIPRIPMPGGPGFYVVGPASNDLTNLLSARGIPWAVVLDGTFKLQVVIEVEGIAPAELGLTPAWGGTTVRFRDARVSGLVEV